MQLVLSLYPGADLLGRAFHHAGFAVVLGPDLLWDSRIEEFHVPPNRFNGIIGGPPCTHYSDANRNRNPAEGDRLVGHFLRIVDEGMPEWFVLENVRNIPDVRIRPYHIQRLDMLDLDFGGRQTRLRHIQFGSLDGSIIRPPRTQPPRPVTPVPTVTTADSGPGDRHCRRLAKQGFGPLPLRSLTPTARRRVIGNGVPFGIGYALALAVSQRSSVTPNDCICLCGRQVTPPAKHATAACRKRMERRRHNHTRTITFNGLCAIAGNWAVPSGDPADTTRHIPS